MTENMDWELIEITIFNILTNILTKIFNPNEIAHIEISINENGRIRSYKIKKYINIYKKLTDVVYCSEYSDGSSMSDIKYFYSLKEMFEYISKNIPTTDDKVELDIVLDFNDKLSKIYSYEGKVSPLLIYSKFLQAIVEQSE